MTDAGRELAERARSGDVPALGALLREHRAAMMAVALSVLRRPDDAEDVVQEAALTALARIGQLRDPAAAGPWLKTIVRNHSRARLRAREAVPMAQVPEPRALSADPAELLERHAMRDWVAYAVGQLTDPLRTVTLLRYFSTVTSHQDIAALCGVPVGTVKRRLHESRRVLTSALLATRDRAVDGAGRIAGRRAEAEQAVAAGHAGTFESYLRAGWHADVDAAWASGLRLRGTAPLVEVMNVSMAAGIRQRVADVAATRGLVLWELDVLNPADLADGCPPRAYWLMSLDAGRVCRLRLFHRAATG
ncbi:RNA polymerase sigma factor [Actinoplanes sp. NPDC049265]|uniref:RNA polymerase sigma factor n=1 Tax=Actinoplanes sp. NPDC049265 TaxID=3363902 RepID=UPI003720B31D